jgi:hypothetical protein
MPEETPKPKKPRKKKTPKGAIEFAARKDGVMKLFKTEEEAFEYAEPNSSIAKYKCVGNEEFEFVGVVGIKTDAGRIGKILQEM